MTDPFELHVAKALAAGVAAPCPLCEAHAEEFAPRIAAAFRQTVDGEDAQAQADFVAALRGTPGT